MPSSTISSYFSHVSCLIRRAPPLGSLYPPYSFSHRQETARPKELGRCARTRGAGRPAAAGTNPQSHLPSRPRTVRARRQTPSRRRGPPGPAARLKARPGSRHRLRAGACEQAPERSAAAQPSPPPRPPPRQRGTTFPETRRPKRRRLRCVRGRRGAGAERGPQAAGRARRLPRGQGCLRREGPGCPHRPRERRRRRERERERRGRAGTAAPRLCAGRVLVEGGGARGGAGQGRAAAGLSRETPPPPPRPRPGRGGYFTRAAGGTAAGAAAAPGCAGRASA